MEVTFCICIRSICNGLNQRHIIHLCNRGSIVLVVNYVMGKGMLRVFLVGQVWFYFKGGKGDLWVKHLYLEFLWEPLRSPVLMCYVIFYWSNIMFLFTKKMFLMNSSTNRYPITGFSSPWTQSPLIIPYLLERLVCDL